MFICRDTIESVIICLFVRDLFNAAFVSCWTELSETQQDELINSLEQALTSQDLSEITQALLNLAEFMEHCDKVTQKINITLKHKTFEVQFFLDLQNIYIYLLICYSLAFENC